jgi:hypothetical protein
MEPIRNKAEPVARPTQDRVTLDEPQRRTAEKPLPPEPQTAKPQAVKSAKKKRKIPSPHKVFKKISKKVWLIIVAVAVVIVVAVLAVTNMNSPVQISEIETFNTSSVNIRGETAQKDFVLSNPIMLHFKYSDATTGVAVTFIVTDSAGEVVKSGTTPVLRESDDNASDGEQSATIMNGYSARLGVGKYDVILKVGDRKVGGTNFKIVE